MSNGDDDTIILCNGVGEKTGTVTVELPFYKRGIVSIAWNTHGMSHVALRTKIIRALVYIIKLVMQHDDEEIYDGGWKKRSEFGGT